VLDDPAPLLRGPGEEAGDVLEGEQRDIEGVTEADEAGALEAGVHVEAAGQDLGLVGHDPHGLPVVAGEPHHDVLGVALLDLEEDPVVGGAANHLAHVVRLVRVVGDELPELLVPAVPGVGGLHDRRVFDVVGGQEPEQRADPGEAVLLVGAAEVRYAGGLLVGAGAAEFLHGDLLVACARCPSP
jgi:hypothetical protein